MDRCFICDKEMCKHVKYKNLTARGDREQPNTEDTDANSLMLKEIIDIIDYRKDILILRKDILTNHPDKVHHGVNIPLALLDNESRLDELNKLKKKLKLNHKKKGYKRL